MKKIYYLSTCNTCKRIMSELGEHVFDEALDIKTTMPSEEELDSAANRLGGYKAIFNTRARKLRSLEEDEKPRQDADYKALIMKDYTFLKRPFFILGDAYYAGNSKSTLELVKKNLHTL